jgi:hypothetical protein
LSAHVSPAELRKFGLIVGGMFAGLFGVLFPWIRHAHVPLWPWLLAMVLIASALIAPQLLRYPYIVWERIGKALGWVNSRIILNVLFFLVFAPAGIVARLFKWDPLKREFEPNASSYRIISKRQTITEMEKPY